MIQIITRDDNTPLFAYPNVRSNDYDSKEHGPLFVSQQNRSDRSRGLRVTLGSYIAGPPEFFLKYHTKAFVPAANVPPPTIDQKTKQAIYSTVKVVVINVKKGEDWQSLEREIIDAVELPAEDSKIVRELKAENAVLRETMDVVINRLNVIEDAKESAKPRRGN